MIILVIVGVLLVFGVLAVIRQSRMFRGSGSHFEAEDRFRGELSKGMFNNSGGS